MDSGVDQPAYALYDKDGNSHVHFTSRDTINYFFKQGQLKPEMIHDVRTSQRIVDKVAESFPGMPKDRFSEASLDEII